MIATIACRAAQTESTFPTLIIGLVSPSQDMTYMGSSSRHRPAWVVCLLFVVIEHKPGAKFGVNV